MSKKHASFMAKYGPPSHVEKIVKKMERHPVRFRSDHANEFLHVLTNQSLTPDHVGRLATTVMGTSTFLDAVLDRRDDVPEPTIMHVAKTHGWWSPPGLLKQKNLSSRVTGHLLQNKDPDLDDDTVNAVQTIHDKLKAEGK